MSDGYQVRWEPAARRAVDRLPRDIQRAVVETVTSLAAEPRPAAPLAKPLTGRLKGSWRLRLRGWRVL